MVLSVYFTGPLYERMAEDLHLGGMSERTHAGYLRAVRKLADYCQTPPDDIPPLVAPQTCRAVTSPSHATRPCVKTPRHTLTPAASARSVSQERPDRPNRAS